MGATKERLAVSAALLRAAEIGRQVEEIAGDVGLQRLSKAAWLRQCVEMGGFADSAALEAARATIRGLPYLNGLIERMARRWVQNGQERPSVDGIFANGDAELAAYAERLSAGLSVEQASAVLSARVAEIYSPEYWGRLGDFAEVAALLEPLERELLELDDALSRDLLVRDIAWDAGRATLRATLRAASLAVVLDADTAARPATALALAARNAARGLQQAA